MRPGGYLTSSFALVACATPTQRMRSTTPIETAPKAGPQAVGEEQDVKVEVPAPRCEWRGFFHWAPPLRFSANESDMLRFRVDPHGSYGVTVALQPGSDTFEVQVVHTDDQGVDFDVHGRTGFRDVDLYAKTPVPLSVFADAPPGAKLFPTDVTARGMTVTVRVPPELELSAPLQGIVACEAASLEPAGLRASAATPGQRAKLAAAAVPMAATPGGPIVATIHAPGASVFVEPQGEFSFAIIPSGGLTLHGWIPSATFVAATGSHQVKAPHIDTSLFQHSARTIELPLRWTCTSTRELPLRATLESGRSVEIGRFHRDAVLLVAERSADRWTLADTDWSFLWAGTAVALTIPGPTNAESSCRAMRGDR